MNSTILNRQRLIDCRKKLNITKQEAAKRMQMSQPAYVRYESGVRTPSIHVIKSMANVLHTSVAYLTDESDNPAPDCYLISSAADPELFHMIEVFENTDKQTKNRLLSYMQQLNNSAK